MSVLFTQFYCGPKTAWKKVCFVCLFCFRAAASSIGTLDVPTESPLEEGTRPTPPMTFLCRWRQRNVSTSPSRSRNAPDLPRDL